MRTMLAVPLWILGPSSSWSYRSWPAGSRPWSTGVLMLGVVLLVALGFAINRLAGVDYPAWRAAVPPNGAEPADGPC